MPLAHAQLVNTTRVKRVSGSNKIGGSAVMLAAGFWGAPRHRDLGIFILPRGSAGWNHPWNRLFQLQTRNSKAEVLHKISSFFNLPPWSTMTTFGRGRETFREREQTQVLDIRNKLPLPSTTMNAGKFSTSIFHTASMPSSGYSRTSTWHRSMARQSSVDDKKRGTFTRIFPQFANRVDGRGGDSRLTRARLELRSDGPCITHRRNGKTSSSRPNITQNITKRKFWTRSPPPRLPWLRSDVPCPQSKAMLDLAENTENEELIRLSELPPSWPHHP